MSASRLLAVAALTVALAACDATAPSAPTEVARIGPDGAPAAKAEKVTVCHARGDGTYRALRVSANALGAHLRHGDSVPGDAAPGGGTFDDACEVVEEEPLFACTIDADGPNVSITLDVLDTDAIRSRDVGVSRISGAYPNILVFDITYTADETGVVSATTVLAPNPDGPYEASLDLLDSDGEELLAECGPVSVG